MADKKKSMEAFQIPTLEPCDIECRIGQKDKSSQSPQWVTLLLYKDARCDMRILDQLFTPFGWKREHFIRENVIKDQRTMLNYCRVSIFNPETKEWVYKEDVGTESNTENAKGESSDAFKRACVNWGIGRELYSAPFIFIKALQGENLARTKFRVVEIKYDKNNNVNHLVIFDDKNNKRFEWSDVIANQDEERKAAELKRQEELKKYNEALDKALAELSACQSLEDFNAKMQNHRQFWNDANYTKAGSQLKARFTA